MALARADPARDTRLSTRRGAAERSAPPMACHATERDGATIGIEEQADSEMSAADQCSLDHESCPGGRQRQCVELAHPDQKGHTDRKHARDLKSPAVPSPNLQFAIHEPRIDDKTENRHEGRGSGHTGRAGKAKGNVHQGNPKQHFEDPNPRHGRDRARRRQDDREEKLSRAKNDRRAEQDGEGSASEVRLADPESSEIPVQGDKSRQSRSHNQR